MRVIAKKRCRAMVEPPEKGERATLNPNLSTKLNLRLSFNAKTLKLCSKIKLATQGNQRMFDVGSSPTADILR
jgi:hypothetical protein